jgi:hypothetical protein
MIDGRASVASLLARTRRGPCAKPLRRQFRNAGTNSQQLASCASNQSALFTFFRVEPAPVQKFRFVLRDDSVANVIKQILAAAAEREQAHEWAIENRDAHRSRQIKLDNRSGGTLVAELFDAVAQPRGQPDSIRIAAIHDGIENVSRLVVGVESKRFPDTSNIGDFDIGSHRHRRAQQAFANPRWH